MDRYWLLMLTGLICLIAWKDFNYRAEIEELRSELQREQREQLKYLLQLLQERDSKYEVLVKKTNKERSQRQEMYKAMKKAIDGLFDINDYLRQHISKLKNDHKVTVATQQAKIDQLEQENQDLKAELRRDCQIAISNMEDKLQREYRAEDAMLEKKMNDNHKITNETLQWHVSKLENDHQVTKAAQQAKTGQLEEDIRDLKAEQREYRIALGNMEGTLQSEFHAEIATSEKKANDNHQLMNETIHNVVEWFISEIEQLSRECKNNTLALAEEIRQIKSREPVVVQNEVVIQNGHHLQESTHHYRNWGAQYGAMVGEIVGGYAQDVVTGLWSRAIRLLARLK